MLHITYHVPSRFSQSSKAVWFNLLEITRQPHENKSEVTAVVFPLDAKPYTAVQTNSHQCLKFMQARIATPMHMYARTHRASTLCPTTDKQSNHSRWQAVDWEE